MKLSIALFPLSMVANVFGANVFSHLGFMRTVSNRLPNKHSDDLYVRSIGGIRNRRKGHNADLVKSRRLRNTLTNEKHLDQPILYRTNPTYAMKPDVLNRIKYPNEMKPAA